MNFTAELLTAVTVDVPAGDDWRHDAYNAAVAKVEALLASAFKGKVLSFEWDIRHHDIHDVHDLNDAPQTE